MKKTRLKLALAFMLIGLGPALPASAVQLTHALEADVQLDWFTDSTSSTPSVGASITALALAPSGNVAFALGGEGPIGYTGIGLSVMALDQKTGANIWSTSLPTFHVGGSELVVGPLGKVLYVRAGTGGFGAAALDTSTGAILWERTWNPPAGFGGYSHSMILSPDGSKLYISGQSEDQDPVFFFLFIEATLFALDAQTGTELWVDTYPSPTYGSAVGNDVAINPMGTQVFLTGEAGQVLFVRSLDATSGAVSWTTPFELGSLLGAAPGTSSGTNVMVDPTGSEVYVTGRASTLPTVPGSESLTLTLQAATGNVLWTMPMTAADITGDHESSSVATLSGDGSLLFTFSVVGEGLPFQFNLRTRCRSTVTGALLWQSDSKTPSGGQGLVQDIRLSPDGQRLLVTGKIFLMLPLPLGEFISQRTLSYDANSGAELWSADLYGDDFGLVMPGGIAAGDDFSLVGGTNTLLASGGLGFVARYADAPLVSGPPELSLSQGGALQLRLSASAAAAADTYLILGSLSGTTPGLMVGSMTLPLNFDAYFLQMLYVPNGPIHSGSLGVLDAQGRASTVFVLPVGLSPALAGITLHHAYFGFNSLGVISTISNPSSLKLVP